MENKEHISSTKYLTVFWGINREKNKYISVLIDYARKINSEFKNDAHLLKCAKWKESLNEYDNFINSIEGLDVCLTALLEKHTYTKIKQYEYEFLNCCNLIYEELCKNTCYDVDHADFINFMYEHTCEGRVVGQNKFAYFSYTWLDLFNCIVIINYFF